MSEQEFVPRSGSDEQDALNDEDEIYQPQYPYHWSGQINQEGGPRDEPPSSYAEPTIQYGYRAQDYASTARQQNNTTNNTSQQWSSNRSQGAGRQYGPDGDAFEQGYRPNNTYSTYNSGQGGQWGQWNTPPWARPQPRRRGSMGWLFLIIFLFFILRPMFLLFAGLGVAFLGVVVPILLFLLVLSIFRFVLRAAFWPGRSRRFRRGPFWW